eukprot:6165299-Pleurochrysis_carterae.AAC.2
MAETVHTTARRHACAAITLATILVDAAAAAVAVATTPPSAAAVAAVATAGCAPCSIFPLNLRTQSVGTSSATISRPPQRTRAATAIPSLLRLRVRSMGAKAALFSTATFIAMVTSLHLVGAAFSNAGYTSAPSSSSSSFSSSSSSAAAAIPAEHIQLFRMALRLDARWKLPTRCRRRRHGRARGRWDAVQ